MRKINVITACLACFLGSVNYAGATEIEDTLSTDGASAMFGESQGRIDLNAVQYAFDDTNPMSNTLIVNYKEGETVKVAVREFMTTGIYFPEEITDFVIGDNTNFTWTPSKNKRWGNIAVRNRGADTNLILIGNSGNSYNLYIRSIGVENEKLPLLMVKYVNPKIQASNNLKIINTELNEHKGVDGEYLRHLKGVRATDINTGYFFKAGNQELKPKLVFDDGVFTYFKFAEKNLDKVRRLPTVYRVVDGYDNPVNTRISGGTLIAEIVSDKWTLRHGTSHACIRKGQ